MKTTWVLNLTATLVLILLHSIGAKAQTISDTASLRIAINTDIVTNNARQITADKLNRILNGVVNVLPGIAGKHVDTIYIRTGSNGDTLYFTKFGVTYYKLLPYVTLAGKQTITGQKYFNPTFSVDGSTSVTDGTAIRIRPTVTFNANGAYGYALRLGMSVQNPNAYPNIHPIVLSIDDGGSQLITGNLSVNGFIKGRKFSINYGDSDYAAKAYRWYDSSGTKMLMKVTNDGAAYVGNRDTGQAGNGHGFTVDNADIYNPGTPLASNKDTVAYWEGNVLKKGISPAKLSPVYYGSIYNANTWSGTTDFTTNGATASVSSSKIVVGHSSSVSTLDYNYTTLLEHFNISAKIKATSTSAIAGIGVRSINAYQGFGLYANLSLATGVLTIHTTNSLPTYADNTVATAGSALTVNTNDYILLNIERNLDTVYVTARNITTGSDFVKVQYTYLTNDYTYPTPNTGKFALYAPSGSFTLDSLSITSKEIKNANLLVVTDSKGEYISNDFRTRWPQQIANLYYPTVNSVGGTDGVNELLAKVPEIIALSPKKVLLLTGRNDLNFGTISLDTIEARYSRAVTQLQAAGISVYHLNGIYETSVDQTAYSAWINTTYGANVINTFNPTQQVPNILYSDAIHPNQAGNDLIAKIIAQSGKFGDGLNYSDIVRLNTPPPPTYVPTVADATHAGIVSLSPQTLGAGAKTMDKVVTTSSFDLPATSNSDTGVLNINGNHILHRYGSNTNMFTGESSGNFSTTGINLTGHGYNSLHAVTTGNHNTGIGANALAVETTGSGNTAVGTSALSHSYGNDYNTAIGFNACINCYATSNNNITIGPYSGSNSTFMGSGNIFIGPFAGAYPSAIPNGKLDIKGGNGYSLISGDFNNGQVEINHDGSLAFDNSAAVRINSTTRGFLFPRLTTTQRNAISSPANGLWLYDSSLKGMSGYNGAYWHTNSMALLTSSRRDTFPDASGRYLLRANIDTVSNKTLDTSNKTQAQAYSLYANNTNALANQTAQTFRSQGRQNYDTTGLTWVGTTAPNTAQVYSYSWQQVGNMVTVTFNFLWSNAGSSLSSLLIRLPSDMPSPLVPSGVPGSSANYLIGYGNGALNTTSGFTVVTARAGIRRNSANTAYEVVITNGTALNANSAVATITYFTN